MIYKSLADINLDNFDTFIFDAFGVFNFGGPVSKAVMDVMADLVSVGKSVSIMSNTPVTINDMEKMYNKKGFQKGLHYQNIFSSGQVCFDAAVSGTIPVNGKKFYVPWEDDFTGLADSVKSIFEHSDYKQVKSIEDADFIYCEYPIYEQKLVTEVDILTPEIEMLKQTGLPIVCANPDLYFLWQGVFVVGPGLVCKILEQMGADVIYYGKPNPRIYKHALNEIGNPDVTKILMIGDTLGTDILGATRVGIKTCLTLEQGISARDLINSGQDLTEDNLHAAASGIGAKIDYIIEKVPECDL
ncbi:MAG: TIGR01459 family HAD-type hydrolase [Alphaproteobacteria bacterium]|nr:TIGR01459 family HAD-type hydrolase [Alphaproteobacteria bacterium]MBN2674970.1 TIGR01459 family HAD-type hydrolase [Alphaproteobacteria bacterium]